MATSKKTSGPRILLWDIESTNLKADFGYMLAFGYKWLDEKRSHVLSIADDKEVCGHCGSMRNPTDDTSLVHRAAEILDQADVWVTWYGKRFDVPFVSSRLHLATKGKQFLSLATGHVDGWEIARSKLKLHSNRLASVSAFLGLEEKTPLSGPRWTRAMAGNIKDLKYVVAHCRQDVIVLEQAYLALRPLAQRGALHPNLGVLFDDDNLRCPICGSDHIILWDKRYVMTTAGLYQRYRCQDCGSVRRGRKRIATTPLR